MPTGLYSDPYLKSLIEERPDLAEQFFQTIADLRLFLDKSVTLCLETPGWLLEKCVEEREESQALENPNFPEQKFAELIQNQEFLESNFSLVTKYPKITQTQINALIKNKDLNVKGLALMHPLGDKEHLLKYLENITNKKKAKFYIQLKKNNFKILRDICKNIWLTDDIFNILFEKVKYKIDLKSDETIGDVLLENISLTDAQKTQLLLSDIKMKKEENSSRSHKEKQKQFNYISSLVFYQILDFDRLSKEISEFDSELSIFFAKKGHPLTCLIKDVKTNKIDLNIDGLKEINSNGILNQLFWTELSERDDFEIVRNASIDSDYVYYDHPILEHQLNITEEFGGTENFSLGGGVMLTHADYEASWLIFNDENFFYMDGLVAHSILTFDENSITPIIQETKETYNLGAVLLSLVLNEWTVRYQDEEDIYIVDKYGFKTSCEGVEIERWLFTFAWQHEERADFDYFSATAKLNPDYNGKLSWRNLPIEKQKAIFDLLSLGLQEPDSKLRNDAIHFLGCMALHEDTPQELLNQLGNLNIPLVADSLNSR